MYHVALLVEGALGGHIKGQRAPGGARPPHGAHTGPHAPTPAARPPPVNFCADDASSMCGASSAMISVFCVSMFFIPHIYSIATGTTLGEL